MVAGREGIVATGSTKLQTRRKDPNDGLGHAQLQDTGHQSGTGKQPHTSLLSHRRQNPTESQQSSCNHIEMFSTKENPRVGGINGFTSQEMDIAEKITMLVLCSFGLSTSVMQTVKGRH